MSKMNSCQSVRVPKKPTFKYLCLPIHLAIPTADRHEHERTQVGHPGSAPLLLANRAKAVFVAPPQAQVAHVPQGKLTLPSSDLGAHRA